MPGLAPCGDDLVMSITGVPDLPDIIFSVMGQVRVSGSNNLNRSPIPAGSTSIDHIVRNPDLVTFSGIMGCAGCRTVGSDLFDVLAALKRSSARFVYDATFANLFWNHGSASNMILKSYTTRQNQTDVQTISVTMNFEAANIQGEITAPSFRAGGINA